MVLCKLERVRSVRLSFLVLFVSLGPQKDALVGFDAGEGCGWNEAAVDQVVLQVNRHQRGVLTGRSVTQ